VENDPKHYPLSTGESGGQRCSLREDTTGVAMTGEIKKVMDKGFGFISGEDHKEYFFHRSGFNGDWDEMKEDVDAREKVYVEFDIEASPKGPRAGNVERLDKK